MNENKYKFIIKIKTPSNKFFKIKVNNNDTIQNIKQKICLRKSYILENFILILPNNDNYLLDNLIINTIMPFDYIILKFYLSSKVYDNIKLLNNQINKKQNKKSDKQKLIKNDINIINNDINIINNDINITNNDINITNNDINISNNDIIPNDNKANNDIILNDDKPNDDIIISKLIKKVQFINISNDSTDSDNIDINNIITNNKLIQSRKYNCIIS